MPRSEWLGFGVGSGPSARSKNSSGDQSPQFKRENNCEKRISFSLIIAIVALAAATAQAVNIVTVPVGDAGNTADGTGYGAVGYNYNISKYDVTNNQYCQFLSTVAAASDPYGLWSAAMGDDGVAGITRSGSGPYAYAVKTGQGNQPVVDVTWYDTLRFANWLTDGNTETGSYAITGSGPNWTVTIPNAAQRQTWASGSAHWLLRAKTNGTRRRTTRAAAQTPVTGRMRHRAIPFRCGNSARERGLTPALTRPTSGIIRMVPQLVASLRTCIIRPPTT